MKGNFFLLIVYLIAFFNVRAQDFKTENKYLQIINKQETDLIVDNIRNAEFIADKYVFSSNNICENGDLFFLNLAKSYFILHKNDYVIFSVLRQRVFFPVDTLDNFCEDIYFDAAKIVGNIELAKKVYQNTMAGKIPEQKAAKISYLLRQMFLLNISTLDEHLFRYSNALKLITKSKLPIFIRQWRFYTMINLDPEIKKDCVDFSGKLYKVDYYSHISSDTVKIEVLKRAYCYYKKRDDYERANYYKKIYNGFHASNGLKSRILHCR